MKKKYCLPVAEVISVCTENYCAIDISLNPLSDPNSFNDALTDSDALGDED